MSRDDEVEGLQRELDIAKGFHKVAVAERDHERHLALRAEKERDELREQLRQAEELTKAQKTLLARVDEVWRGFWTRGGATPPIARERGDGSLAWLQENLERAFREFKTEERPVLTDEEKAELGDIFGAYNEVARLRQEIERLKYDGNCRFSGPGRGDCENFVGLPGHSIPGQHDGEDDTVDAYGKPNGWCWHCWLMYQRDDLQRQLREANGEVEQLRVQLGGCLVAAEGSDPNPPVERGAYGWSPAYATVVGLRQECDRLQRQLSLAGPGPEPPSKGLSAWERIEDGEPEL